MELCLNTAYRLTTLSSGQGMAPEGLESLCNLRYHERLSAIVGDRTLSQLCSIHKQDVGLGDAPTFEGIHQTQFKKI